MRVKICGLTRLEDAELAIELGADALGFNFEPTSPRFVDLHEGASELPLRVAPFVPTVAVYADYYERADCCSLVQALTLPWLYKPGSQRLVIQVFRFEEGEAPQSAIEQIEATIREGAFHVRATLLDGYSAAMLGGSGVRADWELSREIAEHLKMPVILAGGLNPGNVGIAIAKVKPYAVDVSSGVESSPGIKDPIKMRDFIQAAKQAGSEK